MRTVILAHAAIIALGAFFPAAALADDLPEEIAERSGTEKLQPAAPWNIDFGESRCILSRVFMGEDGRHVLFFEQSAPGATFGMTIAGDGLRRFPRGSWTYFGIRSDEPVRPISGSMRGEVPDVGQAIIFPNLSLARPQRGEDRDGTTQAAIDLDDAGNADRVIIKLGSTGLSFETGNLAAPMQALNSCATDLLRVWGLDPAQHEEYTPPQWLNAAEIRESLQRNYPRAALYSNERGIFRVRLIVEEDGSVSNCHVENSTETENYEEPACEEMMNARFEPGLDRNGQPMRSFYATPLVYAGYQ